jgi:uncharacterized membrane protein
MKLLHRHARFFLAFALGLVIFGISLLSPLDLVMGALVAVNGFFLAYLILMGHLASAASPDILRRQAEADDEGVALILTLALVAVVVSLGAIVLVLDRKADSPVETLFALAAAPLGWAMVHVLAAFRYAHLYYSDEAHPSLTFPDPTPFQPGAWDFLYLSFTIGMTAQTSDVQAASPALRRVIMAHSAGAFFYNTVILALAVNAAISLGS